ncbi:hypothetical protein BDD12DRAFT_916273 [Trichophaea hybrida]|nr:hypothetical protein BDD12DRAFT_916273 [Trichophaea hybrida]
MSLVNLAHLILSIMLGLQDQGFISSVTRGSINGPDKEFVPTTQENMSLVSKPTQRIWMGIEGLEEIVQGRLHAYVEGLQPGETLFLGTDKGVLEVREAIKRKIGGQLLCRAS